MNSVWVVAQGPRDDNDDYSWVVAAFTEKETAKKFETDHQAWLDRMEIDHYTDCYEVPFNPEYADDGYVLVEKKNDMIITSPLLHVSLKWVYKAQPDEVVQCEDCVWVIVRAVNRLDAEAKAAALFAHSITGDEGVDKHGGHEKHQEITPYGQCGFKSRSPVTTHQNT